MTTQEVIKEVLKENGWKKKDLARRLGYKSYINLWIIMSGQRELPLDKKKKLAEYSKRSLMDFI